MKDHSFSSSPNSIFPVITFSQLQHIQQLNTNNSEKIETIISGKKKRGIDSTGILKEDNKCRSFLRIPTRTKIL